MYGQEIAEEIQRSQQAYRSFVALSDPARGFDYERLDVISCLIRGQRAMTICAPERATYITKEQAMDFFGLVDPNA